jgi:hypothetical protein
MLLLLLQLHLLLLLDGQLLHDLLCVGLDLEVHGVLLVEVRLEFLDLCEVALVGLDLLIELLLESSLSTQVGVELALSTIRFKSSEEWENVPGSARRGQGWS